MRQKTKSRAEVRMITSRYYQDGLQKRESSGSDKIKKAKELLRKREGAIADGKPVSPKSEKIKFTQLAALVVDDYTINHYKSLESIKGRLKNHIIPAFGHRRATTITTADLTRYVIERQAEGISNANVNRELSVIRRASRSPSRRGSCSTGRISQC